MTQSRPLAARVIYCNRDPRTGIWIGLPSSVLVNILGVGVVILKTRLQKLKLESIFGPI